MRIEELEDDLETERNFRIKAEQQKAESYRELKELQDKLEEAGGTNEAQIELNKRREVELTKLKKQVEEAAIQREHALATLRKKHNEAIHELEQQVETANYSRQRLRD